MAIAKGEVRWIVGLTVLAVIVRCWKIWQPSSVVYVRSVSLQSCVLIRLC
jgi:dolichyl-phosphate-mannose--protein O-mannosyl transferase